MSQPPDQIQYWNETAGPKWVRYQERLDAQLAAIGLAAIDRAAVRSGERAIDVGCGCGATTLELAKRVGRDGSVIGIDVSAPMAEVARRRLAAAGMSHARVELADAEAHRFAPESADLVFSRFCVMFFPDPTAAFRNLHRALRSDGRVAFVCWQPIQSNPWVTIALMAASQHVALPPPPPPEAPGPFSFADPERVRRILGDAGFASAAIDPLETTMDLAGGGTLDEAVDFILQLGPTSAVLKDATDEQRALVTGAVRAAYEPHQTADGLRLGAACWVVTAKAR